MNTKQFEALLQRYLSGQATAEEAELVKAWYDKLVEEGKWQWEEGEKQILQTAIEDRLLQHIGHEPVKISDAYFMRKRKWWIAAASMIGLLGLGFYLLRFEKSEKQAGVVKPMVPHEVEAPDINKATLTLSDGRKVRLDSVGNGESVTQHNVKILKTRTGEIVYQAGPSEGIGIQYNTLENPRGSKVINMRLADGSKIWLNAGSSFSFPVVFVGNKRKVSINGEAYLEIAENKAMPFIVSVNPAPTDGRAMQEPTTIEVLGTSFNVHAYDNESAMQTTLLEGKVKIVNSSKTQVLKPGQQAELTNGEGISIHNDVNIEQAMAWKNGYFWFENTSIKDMMCEIARWYNVRVKYVGPASNDESFTGKIPRNVSLSQLLKIVELSDVKFKINGDEIVILP